jgi:hypothetical protein
MLNSSRFVQITKCALLVSALLGGIAVASEMGGDTYGEIRASGETMAISKLLDHPADYVGKKVRVSGRVVDVCAKRGCWIELGSDREFESLIFKVEDGVMSFPMETKGKWAVAEGVFTEIQLDMDQTRRYVEYQCKERGESFDAAKVTEPKVLYRLQGSGALILDQKPRGSSVEDS